jgi:hypothetical protein
VPLIISKGGITAGATARGYLDVTGRAIWECDAFRTFFEQGRTAFHLPAIAGIMVAAQQRLDLRGAGIHSFPDD